MPASSKVKPLYIGKNKGRGIYASLNHKLSIESVDITQIRPTER